MAIDNADFDSIDEGDLQELVNARVPEGLRLDYKLASYGRADADKRELLKDISAFANSQGGHLIIGVEEDEGAAVSIPGIDIDCDAEILRVEQIVRNALEPPISDIRSKFVNLANGRKAIVIRVPRSWNPPHRVTAQGTNKFFRRHSAGVHEPSIEELRAMFNQSEAALERAKSFRDDRIAKIVNGEGLRPLQGQGRLMLHIVPAASFSGLVNLNVEEIHNIHQAFIPFGATGFNFGFNFHGYRNERGGEINHGYTQIYRNGILEATISSIARFRDGRQRIPGMTIEQYFFERFEHYINGLRRLNVPTPLIAMLSLQGVRGAGYVVSNDIFQDEQPLLVEDLMLLPECLILEYGSTVDYHKAIRPAFDAIWNSIGYARSQFFNADGRWVGNQNRR